MSRNPWLDRLLHSTRSADARNSSELSIRHLERRRVLDAALPTILVSPTPTAEGDTVTVSADAGEISSPTFDWTISVDSVVIATSNSQLFEFTPPDNANYTIDLVVTDADSEQCSASRTIAVRNVAPTLTVVGDQTASEGTPLVIENLGQISDPGFADATLGTAETFTYRIEWGDGHIDAGNATIDQLGGPGVPTLASFDAQHIYADNGNYNVSVIVLDDNGGRATGNFKVAVGNLDPTLTVVGDQTVTEGMPLEIEHLGQISDPGFVNVALGNQETFEYSIDWGDGSPVDSGSATIDRVGFNNNPTLASFDGAHTYTADGNYMVTVTVTDDDGGMTVGKFNVTVLSAAPTLSVAGDQNVDEGSPLSIEDIGMVSIPLFGEGDQVEYSIDWGDGSAVDVGVVTIDQLGTPTLGSFDGQHTYADDGIYSVTITIDDGEGGTDAGSLSVTVGNVVPTLTVAEDQTIDEGALLSITDLGTISDPGFRNTELATDETFTYSIDWGDGTTTDVGAATIDQVGSAGLPTLASLDGSHTYADNGEYTVKVTVTDDDGGMAMDTFTVTVGNVAPTLTVAANQSIDEGALLTIENIGQISDPGYKNDALASDETFSYSIDWGDGTAVDVGIATIDQVGSEGLPTLASLDGAHTYADDGVYTVKVTVTDDDGGMAMDTFTVTVGNVAPTLTVAADQTIDEGSLLTIENIGQITDPAFGEVKEFSYSIDWGDGTALDTGMATIDQIGSEGTPTMASLDGAHTYADNGVYTVTVSVMDDDGGMATETFEVAVNNVAPTLTVAEDQTIDEGALLSIENIGQISDPGYKNDALATDETFSYSIDWGDGTALDIGNATIDQVGSEMVPTLASFDGAHTYADNGTYTVTVTVVDDDLGEMIEMFEVTVDNVAPNLTVSPNQTIDEGALLTLENIGQITDPGYKNDALATDETFTYSIDWGDGTSLGAGAATIDQVGSEGVLTAASFDAQHTYADNGIYTVTVSVMDDDGGMATETFEVTVINVAPTLTVAEDQTINEGSLLVIDNIGQLTDPGYKNDALASDETFTYSIDWGDQTPTPVLSATIDQVGSDGVPTLASFDAQHTYADNGVYTVTVTVTDDDGGVDVETFTVTVNNVAPQLTGVDAPHVLDEGEIFDLIGLGVGLSDPGFDHFGFVDPITPLSTETFTAATIDWGDGTVTSPVDVVNRVSGSPGELTTAMFDHAAHAYADNGTYTVTVEFADDDGAMVSESFTIIVNNVAPTLTLTDESFVINEGDTLNIPLLGSFTDPGFNNPNRPGGASSETFHYEISWGDGTPLETGELPTSLTDGGQGVLTVGSLSDSHLYADNDVDNTYTITVKLFDDDGGFDVQSFDVTVWNVAPTLNPIAAIDITSGGNTILTLSFSDPGTDSFEILVAWGENQEVPVEDRWVVEMHHDGPTPETFVLFHHYDGPPNPDNITADVPITVVIRDDDFSSSTTLAIGQSNIQTVFVGQPGTDSAKFAIDTTPDIPVIEFPQYGEQPQVFETTASYVPLATTNSIDSGGGEVSAATERFFRLHIVLPDGRMLEGIRLPDGVIDDLPALFARLPDNHYRIYFVRGEGQSARLVVDVVLRNHRPTDPADASDGTRDRPPTEELLQPGEAIQDNIQENAQQNGEEGAPNGPIDDNREVELPFGDQTSATPTIDPRTASSTARRAAAASAVAAAALVLDPKTDWAVRLDRAFARADHRQWQRLRRRRPR